MGEAYAMEQQAASARVEPIVQHQQADVVLEFIKQEAERLGIEDDNFNNALDAWGKKDYAKAVGHFRSTAYIGKFWVRWWIRLSSCCRSVKELEQHRKKIAVSLFALGELLYKGEDGTKDHTRAQRYFGTSLGYNVLDMQAQAIAHVRLGEMSFLEKQYVQAADSFKKAVTLEGQESLVVGSRAFAWYRLGELTLLKLIPDGKAQDFARAARDHYSNCRQSLGKLSQHTDEQKFLGVRILRRLGELYSCYGLGTVQEALSLYTAAANQTLCKETRVWALYRLGELYQYEIVDIEKACAKYIETCSNCERMLDEQVDSEAKLSIQAARGWAYYRLGEIETAGTLIRFDNALRDAKASSHRLLHCYSIERLGELCFTGDRGALRDLGRAFALFKEAAQLQEKLTNDDTIIAMEHRQIPEKSRFENRTRVLLRLGLLYSRVDMNRTQDYKEAYRYIKMAYDRYLRMTHDYPLVGSQDKTIAAFNLGKLTSLGLGAERNYSQAAELLREAIENCPTERAESGLLLPQELTFARYRLGSMYAQGGYSLEKDIVGAHGLLEAVLATDHLTPLQRAWAKYWLATVCYPIDPHLRGNRHTLDRTRALGYLKELSQVTRFQEVCLLASSYLAEVYFLDSAMQEGDNQGEVANYRALYRDISVLCKQVLNGPRDQISAGFNAGSCEYMTEELLGSLSARAAYILGELDYLGYAGAHDYGSALANYTKAAEQSYDKKVQSSACKRLSEMHLLGLGVEQNNIQAYYYQQRAVGQLSGLFAEIKHRIVDIASKNIIGMYEGLVDSFSKLDYLVNREAKVLCFLRFADLLRESPREADRAKARSLYEIVEMHSDYAQSKILTEAQARLGLGKLCMQEQNKEQAKSYFIKVADLAKSGHRMLPIGEAYYELGCISSLEKGYKDAYLFFENALAHRVEGNAKAFSALSIGLFLLAGKENGQQSVERNVERATEFLAIAADQDDDKNVLVEASLALGWLYFEGTATSRDLRKAEKYYVRATHHWQECDGDVFLRLGDINCACIAGIEESTNFLEACDWYKKAMKSVEDVRNKAVIMFKLAEIYYKGDRTIASNYKQAAAYYEEASAALPPTSNNCLVCYDRLGEMHYKGLMESTPNLEKAWHYYELLSEQSSNLSWKAVGFLRLGEIACARMEYQAACANFMRVISQTENASIQGIAHMKLADLYYEGLGVEKDYSKALSHYIEASRSTVPRVASISSYRCGDIYYRGYGVIQINKTKAREYYEVAARLADENG